MSILMIYERIIANFIAIVINLKDHTNLKRLFLIPQGFSLFHLRSFHESQVFRLFYASYKNFCDKLGLKYSSEYEAYD